MKTKQHLFFLLIVSTAISLGTFSGCDRGGGGSASKIVKMAFVTNNPSDFWKIASAGVHKYEKEGKVQVDIKMPPNGTVSEQNQILENLSSQGYDAIALSVDAPNDQVSLLNKLGQKTKLITFDSDAPKSNRLLYIGTNNFEAGKVLGNEIVKLLPAGGKAAVFVGTFSADNAAERLKGVQTAIAASTPRIRSAALSEANMPTKTAALPPFGKSLTIWPPSTLPASKLLVPM